MTVDSCALEILLLTYLHAHKSVFVSLALFSELTPGGTGFPAKRTFRVGFYRPDTLPIVQPKMSKH